MSADAQPVTTPAKAAKRPKTPEWGLNPDDTATFRDALDDINNEIVDIRHKWGEKSDRWRESDKGEAIDTWLDLWENGIQDMIDLLDNSTEADLPE